MKKVENKLVGHSENVSGTKGRVITSLLTTLFNNVRENTKYRNCVAHSYAFTLAETIITLSILGIIAGLTIPSVINHRDNANRVKIKKAVDVYANAVESMLAEQGIQTKTEKLDEWAKGPNDDCANVKIYIKSVEGAGCQFKTTDGLWWDFGVNGKMSKALVAFKRADLTKEKAINEQTYDAFFFMTQFDENQKARILDLGYAYIKGSAVNIINAAKIMAFINKKNMYDYYKWCDSDRDACLLKTCTSNTSSKCDMDFYNANGDRTSYRSYCDSNLLNCASGQWSSRSLGVKDGYTYAFSGNCDTQVDVNDCIFYITTRLTDKETLDVYGSTPEFDTDKHIYKDFKLQDRVTKYAGCDVNVQSADDINSCTGSTTYYDDFYKGDDRMQVYYTDSTRTTIKTVQIVSRENANERKDTAIFYNNCKGNDISSCVCVSYKPEYPCP